MINCVAYNKNKLIVYLALVFVIVCAIRSIWLRNDTEKICFFKSGMSTPMLGRFLATISEICFIIILIIVFKTIIQDTGGNKCLTMLVNIILPIIIIAEVLSWIGCITKRYLWNASEETAWTISGIIFLIVSIVLYINNKHNPTYSTFLIVFMISCLLYVIYMITTDVPMYIKQEKKANMIRKQKGKVRSTMTCKKFIKKFKKFGKCQKVSKSYEDWSSEMCWMTGYFTIGVWCCILVVIWYLRYKNKYK
jgi:hypothetical protein